jgi:hypothetical protein
MAVTATPYGAFFTDLLGGVHNVTSDTDKVALLTSAYTPDFTNHVSYADIVGNEVAGTGYTAGGNTLTGKTVSYASGAASMAAAQSTWSALTATCRYAAIYKSTGTNSTSRLIGLIDFGADRTYNGDPLELSFPGGAVTIGAGS